MDIQFPHAGEVFSTLCALFWAVGVILFKKSGEKVSPVPLNLFKDVVGTFLFLATMLVLGTDFIPPGTRVTDVLILLASGALGIGIADSVFFASLNRLGAGRSAIVDCLYSPSIILCSFLYLDEEIGPDLLVALALITVGILIGAWNPKRVESPEERQKIRLGVILGVVSMFLMAVGIVVAKPVLDRTDPLWATTVRLIGGVAILSLQGFTRRYRSEVIHCFRPGRLWKVTMPTAFVGAYLAMFFWIAGMKFTDTTIASILNQLSTIFVLVMATVFLKEPLTLRKTVAIVLGFAGGLVVSL